VFLQKVLSNVWTCPFSVKKEKKCPVFSKVTGLKREKFIVNFLKEGKKN